MKPSTLQSLQPRELSGLIAFEVHPDESDPHECGPLSVVMDRRGLIIRWSDGDDSRWDLTWAELRAIAHNKVALLAERDEIEAEITSLSRLRAELRGHAPVIATIAPKDPR